jgi:hypothetical protein
MMRRRITQTRRSITTMRMVVDIQRASAESEHHTRHHTRQAKAHRHNETPAHVYRINRGHRDVNWLFSMMVDMLVDMHRGIQFV